MLKRRSDSQGGDVKRRLVISTDTKSLESFPPASQNLSPSKSPSLESTISKTDEAIPLPATKNSGRLKIDATQGVLTGFDHYSYSDEE